MKLSYFLIMAAIIVLPLTASVRLPAYPSLPNSIASPSYGYTIYYSSANPYNPAAPGPSPDLNYLPAIQAQHILDSCNNGNIPGAGNPNGYHVGYVNLGFKAPDFGGSARPIYAYDCAGCDSGAAPADAIEVPARLYITSSERCLRSVYGHELFHHVQDGYITFNKWPQWAMAVEGTARMMQDKIYSDLDAWNAAGCCCSYVGENDGFLSLPNRDIWTLSYPSALFWTYLSEQLGTNKGEPTGGANFLVTLWERAQANNDPPDVPKAVKEAVGLANPNETLENLFWDFTIANYTKRMNLTWLPNPDRYRYRDENDGNGLTFGNVAMAINNWPPPIGTTLSVERWGARYLESNVSGCGNGVVGFKASGDQVRYALVAIHGADNVESIEKATGTSFASAYLQDTTGLPYTRLGAIVTGLNDTANFKFNFDCGPATISILEPKTPSVLAYVGAHDAPERFLIKLRVTGPSSLGTPSVMGLKYSDFTAFVGDPNNPLNQAQILGGAYVQGDYWLVAQAPPKPADDDFNLTVRIGTIAQAVTELSVRYAVRAVDQALVIDRSFSMIFPTTSPKIEAAKRAAKLFVDSARSTDQTAVVDFNGNDDQVPNDDADLIYQLQAVTPDSRTAAKAAIDAIPIGLWTSIGDGMYKAYDELTNSAQHRDPKVTERWAILLSDGMENEPRWWWKGSDPARSYLIGAGIKVNTIALGPLTDQPLMQTIATDTGGSYYYVDLPPSTSASSALAAGPTLPILLYNAFAASAERIQAHQRLWELQASLGASQSASWPVIMDEADVQDGLFTIAWDGSPPQSLVITDPNGRDIREQGAEYYLDANHVTFRLPTMLRGRWTISYHNSSSPSQVLAILSGINHPGVSMYLFFGVYSPPVYDIPYGNQFLVGQPVPILAFLVDSKGPLLGASVTATVEHPDGARQALRLFDDGNHNDGQPNDGLYGGLYDRATVGSLTYEPDNGAYVQRGSYNVSLKASGRDNASERFMRFAHDSFNVIVLKEQNTLTFDSDHDGMNDGYEQRHPCLNYLVADADQDPDRDGLTNHEEYGAGTDPCRGDTDGGGESDFSELARGANPLDPSDDLLTAPVDASVVTQVSNDLRPLPHLSPYANLIRFSASTYQYLNLYRSLSPDGPFALDQALDSKAQQGLYLDQELTNGVTYYYYVQGQSPSGALSAPSYVFSGTPHADPFPPIGDLIVANHAVYVPTTSVMLYMPLEDAGADGVYQSVGAAGYEMLISNLPDLSDAAWQPYSLNLLWTLQPGRGGQAWVYARFRDADGNESETQSGLVNVKSAAELGSIRVTIGLGKLESRLQAPLASGAGTFVGVAGSSPYPPAYTDDLGTATLDGLPPGTYKLLIQRPGYQPLLLDSVQVTAGQTTILENQTLLPWQTLLPLVYNR